MSKNSGIAWTTHTWNPVTGCTQVSPGCDNCYALAIAERFRGGKAWPRGFDLTLRPHRLDEPLRWRKPAYVFVNSMSDLFHKDIPDDYLRQVWDVMLRADQHTYQVLTKRAHRMGPQNPDSEPACASSHLAGRQRRGPTHGRLAHLMPPGCAGFRALGIS